MPTDLIPYAPIAAEVWYRLGIRLWGDATCHYGLAQMRLANQAAFAEGESNALVEAVKDLEAAAARKHDFAAFNLGVAHLLGLGVPRADPELAAAWFEASGLPEGLRAVSHYYDAAGRRDEARRWSSLAQALGDGAGWREKAREVAGSGGAGGVELHSMWPRGPAGC